MKIKKASDDVQNMSQSGDAILKSLQNTDFSLTDIIVRESLQNALDASRRNSEQTRVDFVTGEFRTGELNHEFEGIAEKLDELYDGIAEFLAISDRNTCGLDGSYDPKRGNELDRRSSDWARTRKVTVPAAAGALERQATSVPERESSSTIPG